MRKMRIALVLMLLFIGGLTKAQQACTLQFKGRVYSASGTPFEGVVIVPNGRVQVVSDKVGGFVITDLCAGDLELKLSHVGYKPVSYRYVISKDTSVSITLDIDPIHIKDVQIMGEQSNSLSVNTHRLSTAELAENKGKTLARSLTSIAGVTTLSMGGSIVKPVINGMHSNRILIMNNGIRQQGQQWGVEHAPEIDPFLADRLEVIKGAQGVRYGADALGGVVVVSATDIDTRKSIGGRVDITGQSNGRGGALHGRLEGNVKRVEGLAWRVQATGKKLGNYRSADYYLGNTGLEELNYAGTLQYHRGKSKFEAYYSHFGTELGIFHGAHIGTVEDIQARIAHGRPFEEYDFSYSIQAPRQTVTHDLGKFSWKRQLQGDRSLIVEYGLQRNHRKEYDMRRVESDDVPMADMVLTTQSIDLLLKQGNSSVGVQGNVQINNNTPGTGTTPIIPNYDSYNLGLFGIHQFHLGRLHAEVGARYDFKYLDVAGYRYKWDDQNSDALSQYLLTDTRTFHNVSGSLGVLYHINEALSWKSNIGLAWRAPSANELYSDGVHHGSASYEVGDQHLRSEKGLKWINSFLWQGENLRVNVDLYGQLLFDYIYAQPHPDSVRQTIRGTFPLFSYQQHDALFYGGDLRVTYDFSDQFSYDFGASLVRAKNTELDRYLPYIPADRLQHALSWHYAGAEQDGSYLKMTHRFVAAQTRYELNSDYAAPPASYHLFDVVGSKQIAWGTDQKLNVMLAAENIFNTAYKDYMDRFRYFTHQMGRNINLKISYQF